MIYALLRQLADTHRICVSIIQILRVVEGVKSHSFEPARETSLNTLLEIYQHTYKTNLP